MGAGPDPLRRALELAFAVARDDPAPPSALRPLVRFSRLTPVVLDAVRRAVDGDDGFRERVAAQADVEAVGRAGQLWLTRPAGWQEELDRLLEPPPAEVEPVEATPRHGRRAAREEASRARRDEDLRRAREEIEELARRLDEERRTRAGAERALVQAVAERNELSEERAEAVRLLKAAEARAAAVAAERNELRRQLREPPSSGSQPEPGPPTAGPGPVGEVEQPPRRAGAGASGDASTLLALAGPGPIDTQGATRALVGAADAAAALGAALGELAAALAVPVGSEPVEGPSEAPEPSPPGPATRPLPGRSPGASASPGEPPRAAVELPGGVLDDSDDATEHLMRVQGAVCLVDGYNVSQSAWPGLAPAEQRARLVQALGTLAARTGVELDVVFDGADVGPAGPVMSPRGVRVRYSPPAVEADDVILALVKEYPPQRPVIVATSDNRVREGARRGGANLLQARQLLAAIRR